MPENIRNSEKFRKILLNFPEISRISRNFLENSGKLLKFPDFSGISPEILGNFLKIQAKSMIFCKLSDFSGSFRNQEFSGIFRNLPKVVEIPSPNFTVKFCIFINDVLPHPVELCPQ